MSTMATAWNGRSTRVARRMPARPRRESRGTARVWRGSPFADHRDATSAERGVEIGTQTPLWMPPRAARIPGLMGLAAIEHHGDGLARQLLLQALAERAMAAGDDDRIAQSRELRGGALEPEPDVERIERGRRRREMHLRALAVPVNAVKSAEGQVGAREKRAHPELLRETLRPRIRFGRRAQRLRPRTRVRAVARH